MGVRSGSVNPLGDQFQTDALPIPRRSGVEWRDEPAAPARHLRSGQPGSGGAGFSRGASRDGRRRDRHHARRDGCTDPGDIRRGPGSGLLHRGRVLLRRICLAPDSRTGGADRRALRAAACPAPVGGVAWRRVRSDQRVARNRRDRAGPLGRSVRLCLGFQIRPLFTGTGGSRRYWA